MHKQVFVHYLTARGTVDEIIMQAIRTKAHVQDLLLDALKSR